MCIKHHNIIVLCALYMCNQKPNNYACNEAKPITEQSIYLHSANPTTAKQANKLINACFLYKNILILLHNIVSGYIAHMYMRT